MNVDTNSATVTAASSASSSVKTSSAQVNNDAKTDNEFSKELEKASSGDTKAETNAKNSSETKNEEVSSKETSNSEDKNNSDGISNEHNVNSTNENIVLNGNQEYLQGMIDVSSKFHDVSNSQDLKILNSSDILAQNIQALVNTKDQIAAQTLKSSVPSSLDYSTIQMSDDDAVFFADLVQNTDMTMQTIASQIQNDIANKVEGIEQKVKVSSVLMNAIHEGMKTNQPFRIDFDKDVSVILRIDRDGSISANFIPGDKAVEQYLKNNIGFLKQRFDDENLSYKDLSYSQSRNQNRERNNQERKDKEKD